MKYLFLNFILMIHVFAVSQTPFTSTPLTGKDDLSRMMVDGMNRYLDRQTTNAVKRRSQSRNPDYSGPGAYSRSMNSNRKHFARIIGVVDERMADIKMEYVSGPATSALVAESSRFRVYSVKWNVLDDLHGEGLLLQPAGTVKSRVIVVPDADQVPEMLAGIISGFPQGMQLARHLAENGSQVIIPVIINRSCEMSGSSRINLYTNQPHREWIYRQAYTFGRHIIGYEVQKILAAADWFRQQNAGDPKPVGIAGWGEGGLLAFYSAALDTTIQATLVSGYFEKRDSLWKEPIYRNVSGLLREFGDAEIAGMIFPRNLIIEYSTTPEITGPPEKPAGRLHVRNSAAPGRIRTPLFKDVREEVERALSLAGPFRSSLSFIHDQGEVVTPVSDVSLLTFLQKLNPGLKKMARTKEIPARFIKSSVSGERQHDQIRELERHIQQLIGKSRHVRDKFLWGKVKLSTPEEWNNEMKTYRDYFRNEIIGNIHESQALSIPRSRRIYDKPRWTGYEITFDVIPDIFVWGYLLVPKNIKPGERRPVVVVQHGGGGVPSDVIAGDNKTYKALAVQIAELGYVVFAPHFPWKQGDDYRNLQRKANPLGLTVFSFILKQHEQILAWLSSLPFVNSDKTGIYGLSWGGKVAMRIPALLEGYGLSICSGDFNEWIWKNASTDWSNTYMFAPEYEMFDFNLGMTFGHSEMAALIAPRAFMVERGHGDGVGVDEWVAFEYAKVKRLYDQLNIPQMTEIEYFNGVHEIHASGTLKFIGHHFGAPPSQPINR